MSNTATTATTETTTVWVVSRENDLLTLHRTEQGARQEAGRWADEIHKETGWRCEPPPNPVIKYSRNKQNRFTYCGIYFFRITLAPVCERAILDASEVSDDEQGGCKGLGSGLDGGDRPVPHGWKESVFLRTLRRIH